jgi:hypothetical protein
MNIKTTIALQNDEITEQDKQHLCYCHTLLNAKKRA